MHTPQRTRARKAFTLIELLIVIAIIALLIGLISAAVVRALFKGRETQNRIEIGQMEGATDQFKQKYTVYPPSRLRLCECLAWYDLSTVINPNTGQPVPVNQVDTDSVQFIMTMFPKIDTALWTNVGIDWNGNGQIDAPPLKPGMESTGAVTLHGDQVFVFCLGGIPNNPNASLTPSCLGFSTLPANPAAVTQDRIPPLFDFVSSRLVRTRMLLSNNPGNLYYSYLDNYSTSDGAGNLVSGTPYVFFSSYNTPNNYNRYANFSQPPYPTGIAFGASDCEPAAVFPYWQSQTTLGIQYWKPSGFQIISAGRDNTFGVGNGPYNAQTGSSYYAPGVPGGYDDQANFTSGIVGAGPQ